MYDILDELFSFKVFAVIGLLPALLGGVLLLCELFYFIKHKIKSHLRKSYKPSQKKTIDSEDAIWFYNLSLPCEIFSVLIMCALVLAYYKMPYDVSWGSVEHYIFEFFTMMGIFGYLFGVFYLLYQVIYFVCTRILGYKYHASKRSWIIALIFVFLHMALGYLYGSALGGMSV